MSFLSPIFLIELCGFGVDVFSKAVYLHFGKDMIFLDFLEILFIHYIVHIRRYYESNINFFYLHLYRQVMTVIRIKLLDFKIIRICQKQIRTGSGKMNFNCTYKL